MTRDQIKKVSKEGARKAADPKSGKPVSAKHIQRLADLKRSAQTLNPPRSIIRTGRGS